MEICIPLTLEIDRDKLGMFEQVQSDCEIMTNMFGIPNEQLQSISLKLPTPEFYKEFTDKYGITKSANKGRLWIKTIEQLHDNPPRKLKKRLKKLILQLNSI